MDGRISVISIPVSNPDRAKAFYTDELGFEEVMDRGFGPGLRWVMLRPPGAETAITLVTWFDSMPPGSLKGTVFSVPDIEVATSELRTAGTLDEDEEIQSAPWGRWVTVEDPDGNSWVIQQDSEIPDDFGDSSP
jgi:catechol 2,3-dioxygenase-like lactoylglutathione lyase family enzyme